MYYFNLEIDFNPNKRIYNKSTNYVNIDNILYDELQKEKLILNNTNTGQNNNSWRQTELPLKPDTTTRQSTTGLDDVSYFSLSIDTNTYTALDQSEGSKEVNSLTFNTNYIHEKGCTCYACSYERDLYFDNEKNEIISLTNTDEGFTPTISFGTLSSLADYLTTRYWEDAGTYTRKYNLGSTGTGAKSGQLTYNITGWQNDLNGLSLERQNLTREVFKVYEELTGITFVEVSTGGDIRFTDNDSGAYAYLAGGWYDYTDSGKINYSAAITDFSVINIASNWYYGNSSYGGYTPQTIFHEIGHALGLGHQGQYNAGEGSPTYTNSAEFGNDSWSVTMMSYWNQVVNTNISASFAFLQTPMTVDWLAIDQIYGPQGYSSSNAFTGDTIYGIGTNISIETSDIFYNFAQMIGDTSYTLIDGGGNDVLNVSNFSNDQFINLAPSNSNDELPSRSSIGGLINNLTIGANTIIEEAIGGNGNDTFIGNIADNIFRGGGGSDNFYDSVGSDIYYGGSGDSDSIYFSAAYNDFNFISNNVAILASNNTANISDIDTVLNDVEILYFNDDVVKTFEEILSDISIENNQPVAGNVSINATEGSNSVTASFIQTDPDLSDTHTFTITTQPTEGSVVNNNDGTFTFDPGSDFQDLANGESRKVTFQYTATDDSGSSNNTSAPATVTVNVNGTNNQPIAGNVSINATEGSNSVTASFIQTDPDLSDTHTFTITTQPTEGSVVNNNDGTFTFDPGSDFQDLANGESRKVTFQYTATDDSGSSNNTSAPATVTVNVNGTNNQPIAGNVSINATEGSNSVTASFIQTDPDLSDTHTFTITTQPTEGSVVNNNDGTFTFDPGSDFQDLANGESRKVTFQYTATDDSGSSNNTSAPATVTVNVNGTNNQPIAGNVSINATEGSNSVTASFIQTDPDLSDTHTFTITTQPTEGSVVNNNDGTFTFDPGSDFQDLANGESRKVTFQYTATDDSGSSNNTSAPATVTVNVNGTNNQPIAGNVSINATEGSNSVTASFIQTDPDLSDTHTFTITTQPTEGSVVNNNDGTFTFDPGSDFQDLANGESRKVTFQYTATDDSGSSNNTSAPATVTVNVNGTNNQPIAGNVSINATEGSNSVTASFIQTDPDLSDTHTFTITTQPTEGSVVNNNDGTFTFDPGSDFQDLANGESRKVTFQYTATDDSGSSNNTSAPATVTVNVSGRDDEDPPPILSISADSQNAKDEGDQGTITDFIFTVSRNGDLSNESSVQWSIPDGSTSIDDFIATTGSLFFASGEVTKTITVQVNGDADVEADENFSVLLSSPTNATIGTDSASAIIINDDIAPPPILSISADSQNAKDEGDQGTITDFIFTVSRNGDLSNESSVQWSIPDGSTSIDDFIATTGSLFFASGEVTKTITVQVNGDADVEADENFSVLLSSPTNATIGTDSASAIIINDDIAPPPILSISADSQNAKDEGDQGTITDFIFTVSRNGDLSNESSVQWSIPDGSTSIDDFIATTGSLFFASGEVTKTITVQVNGDADVEADENFSVLLSSPTNATIGTDSASAIIINDDIAPPPILSISADSQNAKDEGDQGTITDFIFTVSRNGDLSNESSVQWSIPDGSTSIDDFIATTGSLFFASGEVTKTITVQVNGDADVEADENFSVLLSSPTNATIGTDSASAIIINDDIAPPPILSISADSQNAKDEGNQGTITDFIFTVSRNGDLSNESSVQWSIPDGSTSIDDFIATTGSLFFASGEVTKTITVQVNGDADVEADENFSVLLSSPTNATIGTDSASAIIINDDIAPPPILSISADSQNAKDEGDQGTITDFIFTVSRNGDLSNESSVQWSIPDGSTSIDDFIATTGSLFFASGEVTKTITVQVNGDADVEADENFSVLLSSPTNATIGTDSASAIIINDDIAPPPILSISADSQNAKDEGDQGTITDFIFTVSRNGDLSNESSVQWSIPDGSTSIDDFIATTGSLFFASGEVTKTITVQVNGDADVEADENFSVLLSSPTNATIGTDSASAIIINDDIAPPPILSISADSQNAKDEGDQGTITDFIFTVSRNGDLSNESSVQWSIPDGSTSIDDFIATTGSLFFASGEVTKTITVQVNGDADVEADENFSVLLSSPTNATIGTDSASAIIINDDIAPPPILSISADSQNAKDEGNQGTITDFIFTVSRNGDLSNESSVQWSIPDGSTSIDDFIATTGSLFFASGEVTKTITVQVNGDADVEADENFSVLLSSPTNATIGTDSASAIIINDDIAPPPILSISADSQNAKDEGNQGTITDFIFTVSRNGDLSNESSVQWSIPDGSTSIDDFIATTGSLFFASGEVTKTITVQVNGDADVEADENFSVLLSSPTNATIGTDSASAIIINDDIAPPPILSISADSQNAKDEGNQGTITDFIFTVSRNGDLSNESSVQWSIPDGSTSIDDFIATTGSLFFASGEVTKTITVQVNGDADVEADENFSVLLSSPTNATIGTDSASAIIINDDIAPPPSQEEIFREDFELADSWSNWVQDSQNDWKRRSSRSIGNWAAELDGRARNATLELSNPLDITSFNNVRIDIKWLIETSFDNGEFLALDAKINDGGWIEIDRLSGASGTGGDEQSGNPFQDSSFFLGDLIADYSSARGRNLNIRLRGKASSSREDAYFDNLVITGLTLGDSTNFGPNKYQNESYLLEPFDLPPDPIT